MPAKTLGLNRVFQNEWQISIEDLSAIKLICQFSWQTFAKLTFEKGKNQHG
jgi:hypothetical protein